MSDKKSSSAQDSDGTVVGMRPQNEKGTKKTILRLSEELGDGEHWSICDNERGLIESIKAWYDEFKHEVGESFTVEVIEMTDSEIEALPEL